jgi:cytochrome P450
MGIPTFGKDIQPDLYVITDPHEMRKIVQSQPPPQNNNNDNDDVTGSVVVPPPKYQYPVGIVEQQWPLLDFFQSHNTTLANIFTRGPQWWEARQALQTAIAVPPVSAILQGAIQASQRIMAWEEEDDIASYDGREWRSLPQNFSVQLHRAAFDMFEQVLFFPTNTTNNNKSKEQDINRNEQNSDSSSDALFEATLAGMLQAQDLRRSPWQTLARMTKIPTRDKQICFQNLDTALAILKGRIDEAIQHEGLSSNRCNQRGDSYVLRNLMQSTAMDRSNATWVSPSELPYACLTLLLGAIDTTAGKIAWNVLQLAFHPKIQQDLYHEIVEVVQRDKKERWDPTNNMTITPAVLDKTQTPLLHGVIRETHRVTPAVTVNLIKDALGPVTIHNETLPRQTAVMFDSSTPNLRLVNDSEDPWTFDPYRWFPDAVQSRKTQGPTESRLLDHPYLAQPFGQGPRRCPGAAVALTEVQAFIAQFVLDWEVSLIPRKNADTNNEGNDDLLQYRDVPSVINTGPIPDFFRHANPSSEKKKLKSWHKIATTETNKLRGDAPACKFSRWLKQEMQPIRSFSYEAIRSNQSS